MKKTVTFVFLSTSLLTLNADLQGKLGVGLRTKGKYHVDNAREFVKPFKDAAKWTIQAGKDAADWTGNAIKDVAEFGYNTAKDVASAVTFGASDKVVEFAEDTLGEAVKKVAGSAIDAAKGVAETAFNVANRTVDMDLADPKGFFEDAVDSFTDVMTIHLRPQTKMFHDMAQAANEAMGSPIDPEDISKVIGKAIKIGYGYATGFVPNYDEFKELPGADDIENSFLSKIVPPVNPPRKPEVELPDGKRVAPPKKDNAPLPEVVNALTPLAAKIIAAKTCSGAAKKESAMNMAMVRIMANDPAAAKNAKTTLIALAAGKMKEAEIRTLFKQAGEKSALSLLTLMMLVNGAKPDPKAAINHFRGVCAVKPSVDMINPDKHPEALAIEASKAMEALKRQVAILVTAQCCNADESVSKKGFALLKEGLDNPSYRQSAIKIAKDFLKGANSADDLKTLFERAPTNPIILLGFAIVANADNPNGKTLDPQEAYNTLSRTCPLENYEEDFGQQ